MLARRIALLCLAVLSATFLTSGNPSHLGGIRAQDQARVTATARVVPETVAPGDTATLEVTIRVADGWHVYGRLQNPDEGLPVGLTVTELGGLRLVDGPEIPDGIPHDWFGMQTHWIEGKAVLKQQIKVPAGASAGAVPITGQVDYAACDHSVCEPPNHAGFTATVTVAGGATGTAETEHTDAGSGFGFGDQDPFGLGDAKVTATARVVPAEARPGDEVVLEVELQIVPGRHIYGAKQDESMGVPTTLTVTDAGGLRLVGGAEVPDGIPHGTLSGEQYWIEGSTTLRQRLRIPEGAADGSIEVAARVDYMTCTESACDAPTDLTAKAAVSVAGGGEGGVADGGAKDSLIDFHLSVEPATARPGERVDLIVDVTVAEGWHTFGAKDGSPIALRTTDPGELVPEESNVLPDGDAQGTGDATRHVLGGKFQVRQRYRVPKNAEPAETALAASIAYQLADADGALPVAQGEFRMPITIEAGPVRQEYSGFEPRSVWATILGGILAGLFALLMPCTYPMIPITISFFTKRAEQGDTSATGLALTYGAGIVGMFILIGLVVGEVIINFATHWVTNAVITIAFLYFALSLFGFVNIQPPRALANLSAKASTKGGYAGVFLMGATLVISSFTCTVPFAGTMLSATAAGGHDRIVIGMAAFGATMAAPFVLLSLLPGRLRGVPRAGEWMNTLKVWLGFVELAAALKFLSNVDLGLNGEPHWIPRDTFLWAWALIFAAATIYLILPLLKGTKPAPVRIAGILLTALLAYWAGHGATTSKLDQILTAFAPPSSEYLGDHEIVGDDYPKALALAAEQDKLLLINFTGLVCSNCRVMEEQVFLAEEVAPLLEEGFVESRQHIDYEENKQQMRDIVGIVASPHFVVIDPATEQRLGEFDLSGAGGHLPNMIKGFRAFLESKRPRD